jgi:hypothetical protein
MRLEMEFITRKRLPVLGLACLAIVAALAAVQFLRVAQIRTEIAEKELQIVNLKRSVQDRESAAAVVAVTTPEQGQRIKDQMVMLNALRYPWNRVLADLEQNDQKNVAILSFSHSQSGEVTQLSVEAADVGALVNYVDALNQDQAEIRWYLAGHQLQVQRSPASVKGEIVRK